LESNYVEKIFSETCREDLLNPWKKLFSSPYARNIEQLILYECEFDDIDTTNLIGAPYSFPKLIYVNLLKTKITEFSILMLITGKLTCISFS
jgi:hypothetical protein